MSCQARVKAVSEIVSQLIQGVQGSADVDLNAIKREVTAKYALQRAPKLVEIIAAVPEEWKATLLPRYTVRVTGSRCCMHLRPGSCSDGFKPDWEMSAAAFRAPARHRHAAW